MLYGGSLSAAGLQPCFGIIAVCNYPAGCRGGIQMMKDGFAGEGI